MHDEARQPQRFGTIELFTSATLPDPAAIAEFPPSVRGEFLEDIQRRSRPGAVHVILGSCPGLVPESLGSLYDGWLRDCAEPRRRRRSNRRPDDLVLIKPSCPPDTRATPIAASL